MTRSDRNHSAGSIYARSLHAPLGGSRSRHVPRTACLPRRYWVCLGAADLPQWEAIVQVSRKEPDMRILHTGDWHLADRLGRIDRTDDLRKAVERVAAYCASENVDVLLVAGDLFSELASTEALRDSIRHLQETFAPFLQNGRTILTLTGHHDTEHFCQTLRPAISLDAPCSGLPADLV